MKTHFLFILLSTFHCGSFAQILKADVYQNPKAVAEKLEIAYSENNVEVFNDFFGSWESLSPKSASAPKNDTMLLVDSLFPIFYHPFNFSEYNWKKKKKNYNYKYVILPTTVSMAIVDSIQYDSIIQPANTFELKNYCPYLTLEKSSIIYDDIYYGSVLRMFLANTPNEKWQFLQRWIPHPDFHDQENYLTHPLIICLTIDTANQNALAHLRIRGTQLFVKLSRSDTGWTKHILPIQILE